MSDPYKYLTAHLEGYLGSITEDTLSSVGSIHLYSQHYKLKVIVFYLEDVLFFVIHGLMYEIDDLLFFKVPMHLLVNFFIIQIQSCILFKNKKGSFN